MQAETVRDLGDQALFATLTYSFPRIGAALAVKVEDLRPKGAGWQLRLHEKRVMRHTMALRPRLAKTLQGSIRKCGAAWMRGHANCWDACGLPHVPGTFGRRHPTLPEVSMIREAKPASVRR